MKHKLSVTAFLTFSVLFGVASRALGTPSSHIGNPDRGLPLFSAYCASCHGEDGNGDGPLVARLAQKFDTKPTKLTNPDWQESRTDADLTQIIEGSSKRGHLASFMPAWKLKFSKNEIDDIVAFVRELAHTPKRTSTASLDLQKPLELGRTVYSLQCLACHGRNGKGDGPLMQGVEWTHCPDFTDKSYFRSVTDEQLEGWSQSGAVHANLGVDPVMHTWWNQALTDKELECVILYLRTLPQTASRQRET